MADGIVTHSNVARSWQWIHQVAAPCTVTRSSGITTLNSPGINTLQCGWWLWDDMPLNSRKRLPITIFTFNLTFVKCPCSVFNAKCHYNLYFFNNNNNNIGIPHLVSISTTSQQSTCHSAPVSEILSKSDHPQQKKNHVDFQDGGSQPSWIFGVK